MSAEPNNFHPPEDIPLTGDSPSSGQLVYVGLLSDIPPGHMQLVETPYELVLVVNVEQQLYAVSNICPHAGGYLNYGYLEGYTLDCPLHFWSFDVRTGKLLDMNQPSLDDMNLQTYPLEIKGQEVYLRIQAY